MEKRVPKTTQLMVRDGLDLYFREIHRVPVLSRVEERRFADLWYEKRDREAGRTLVLSNLRFVVKVAQEYTRYGFRLADLIQEGNLGLLHAVDRFDPRKGYRLITYAVWWIKAYIQAFILRSWSIVRAGTTRIQRRIFGGLQKARQKIAALTGASEEPTTRQLADVLEVSESDLKETVGRMQQRDVSIDQPLTPEGDLVLADSLADESPNAEARLIQADLNEKVRGKLDVVYEDLTPRERYLLERRLLAETPATLEAVGAEFGVTRERVRQLEGRLKEKLRLALGPALGRGPVPAVS
jgi:RNA polymerase sigma-32 factor